jgi:hypothetical protein
VKNSIKNKLSRKKAGRLQDTMTKPGAIRAQ